MRILRVAVVGAAAYLLALMAPAMAANQIDHGMYHAFNDPVVVHRLRAQDFDHFDYGIRAPTYHSGWGGVYGDGDYPESIDRNMGPPYWSH